MNATYVNTLSAAYITFLIAACDTKDDRVQDIVQQQWIRVQSDFAVVKLIDSGQGQKALTSFLRGAREKLIGDQAILREFASGNTNNVRVLLNKMIDGWIIQEACHSQHPPLAVLFDSPERLRFLASLGAYREEHPNQSFDPEVDKTVAEILLEARCRILKESTD